MRAVVNRPGSPSPVALEEVDEPRPQPHEALVSVRAFSINRGELRLLAARPAGWRPGQDVAGVVESAAADGSGPPPGSRVVGLVESEGWAERVPVATSRMAVLPEDVEFADAATLPIAGLTALRTLRLGGNLLGQGVLVTGASGAVGGFQVQLAGAAGARVTGVARPERWDEVLDLGADACIASIGEADGIFELILESIGGSSMRAAIDHIAPRGIIVLLGNSSREPTEVSFADFHGHEGARIQDYHSYASEGDTAADLELLAGMLADGSLLARVDHRAPWTNVAGALEKLKERKVVGKAVLEIT